MTIPSRTWDLGANIKCNWSTWRKKALPREEQKWLKSCEHGELGLLLYVVWVWIALARIRWWVVASAVFLSYLVWLGGEHPRDRPRHLHLPPPHGLPLPLCQVICLLKMSLSRFIWSFNSCSRLLRGTQKTPRSVSLTSRLGNLCRINSFTYLQVNSQ